MLAPICITPPAEVPVSLDEVRQALRVDAFDDDELLTGLILAAVSHLDGWAGILGRALVTQTWRQDFSGFPPAGILRLPLAPVSAVESVAYTDMEGVSRALDPEMYAGPLADGLGPYIRLAPNRPLPPTAHRDDAVRVTFLAGYGAPHHVPFAIRRAILLLVGHWYANREAAGAAASPLPFGPSALLAPYRRVCL